jgi:peptidylprolyl isomerase
MARSLAVLVVLVASFQVCRAAELPGYLTTYELVSEGSGAEIVSKGSSVTVHATGVVKESGYKFWSTKDPGQQPFSYKAGVGGVITGWDQGCLGMKLGEVRRLTIPSTEGYGANGFPAWKIPPKATLSFEIEVLKIKGGGKSEL